MGVGYAYETGMTPKRLTCYAAAGALLSLLLCPTAFANGGSCGFKVAGNLQLNFGTLDPSSGVAVTRPVVAATVGSDQVGSCNNVSMTVQARTGSVLELTNGSGGIIPYTLTTFSAPAPGNNTYTQLVLQGTVPPANYQNAPAGIYTQSNVFLDISP